MMRVLRFSAFAFAAMATLAGCQAESYPIGPEVARRPPASVKIPVGALRTVALATGDVFLSVTVPPAVAGSGTVTVTASLTQPVQIGNPAAFVDPIEQTGSPIVFVTLTADDTATYDTFPTPAYTLPASVPASDTFYLNYLSPTYEIGSVAGPVSATDGTSVYFSPQTFGFAYPGSPSLAPPLPVTLIAGDTYTFGLYENT